METVKSRAIGHQPIKCMLIVFKINVDRVHVASLEFDGPRVRHGHCWTAGPASPSRRRPIGVARADRWRRFRPNEATARRNPMTRRPLDDLVSSFFSSSSSMSLSLVSVVCRVVAGSSIKKLAPFFAASFVSAPPFTRSTCVATGFIAFLRVSSSCTELFSLFVPFPWYYLVLLRLTRVR